MRWKILGAILSSLLTVPSSGSVYAADNPIIEQKSFAGGVLTITENADFEKVVSFDGKELGRDYQAYLDRMVTVGGVNVALVSLGQGGNACGPYTLIIWDKGDRAIGSTATENDCLSPSIAVTDYAIVFMPYVGPGDEAFVRRWTPLNGFETTGILRFSPEPGTRWSDLAVNLVGHPVEYFSNEGFFRFATDTLGDKLSGFAAGLGVASAPVAMNGGLYGARGCMPHNCGGADSFVIIDINAQTAWFAQLTDNGIRHWPDVATWTFGARAALAELDGG